MILALKSGRRIYPSCIRACAQCAASERAQKPLRVRASDEASIVGALAGVNLEVITE
jgi:hypothetical protein